MFKEHSDKNLDVVLARVILDYRKELPSPGAVDIGDVILQEFSKDLVDSGLIPRRTLVDQRLRLTDS